MWRDAAFVAASVDEETRLGARWGCSSVSSRATVDAPAAPPVEAMPLVVVPSSESVGRALVFVWAISSPADESTRQQHYMPGKANANTGSSTWSRLVSLMESATITLKGCGIQRLTCRSP